MDIACEKRALRQEMKSVLNAVPTEVKTDGGRSVCQHIKSWLKTSSVSPTSLSVALFKSLPDEISTAELDEYFASIGAQRAVACADSTNEVQFRGLSRDETLETFPHESGLHMGDNGESVPFDFDIIFIPGLAFDSAGNRLGRGRGCFDRTLANLVTGPKRPLLVGLLLDEQFVGRVPATEHDVAIDYVCTPKRGVVKMPNRECHD